MAKKEEARKVTNDPYEIIMDVSFKEEEEAAKYADDPLSERLSKKPAGHRIVSDEFDDTKATLPQREVERLMNVYTGILVKEFGEGDKHHLEEEDPLHKRGRRIPTYSGKMADYVKACREYIDILIEYSKEQTYMPQSLFLSMVEDGTWKIDWLHKPEMNKHLRGKCNFDSLIPYILDPNADLSALDTLDEERELYSTGSQNIDFDDPEALDAYRRETYPPEMYHKLFVERKWEKVPEYSRGTIPKKYKIKIMSEKRSREFAKDYPEMIHALRGYLRVKRKADQLTSRGNVPGSGFSSWYRSVEDDFELIEDFEKYFGNESDRPPRFELTDIMGKENKEKLDEYLGGMDYYLDYHELWVDNRGRTMNRREYINQEIKDLYESKGINVRKFVNFNSENDPDKVVVELRDRHPRAPRNKREEIEDLLYSLYLKNQDRIEKDRAKAMKKARERKEFNDYYFGDGYKGTDEEYYNDVAGDALDEAIEYAGNQTMKAFFGDRYDNFRDMVVDMQDMSWDNIMGRK